MNGYSRWVCLAVGSLSLAAAQWLTLWLLAHTASADTAGSYSLAVGLAVPICALGGLQLRTLMATDPHMGEQLRAYLDLRMIALASLGLFIVLLFLMEIPGYRGSALLGAVLLSRTIELGSDFVDGLRHRDRSYFALGISQCVRSGLSFTVFAAVWMVSSRLIGAILAAASAALLSLVLIDLPELFERRPFRAHHPDEVSVEAPKGVQIAKRKILVFALPLAVVHFLNLGVVVLPRLLLGKLSTLENVAVFTCLTSVVGVMSLLASAYNATFAPDFADAFGAFSSRTSGHAELASTIPDLGASEGQRPVGILLLLAIRNTGLLLAPLGVLLAVAGEPVLRWLYGPSMNFSSGAICLTAIFAVLWGLSTVFGTAATAARRIRLQVQAFLLALAGGVLTGFVLIPVHGVVGASASLVVSAAVLLSSYVIAFRRDLRECRQSGVSARPVASLATVKDRFGSRMGERWPIIR